MFGRFFRRRPMQFDPSMLLIRDNRKVTASEFFNDLAEDIEMGQFGEVESMIIILNTDRGTRYISRGINSHGDMIRLLACAQLECVNDSEAE